MSSIFQKLNLKTQPEIVVINAPDSFEAEIAKLEGVVVQRDLDAVERVAFALAFVLTQAEVNALARGVAAKTEGDAIVWFAYPKASSKRYKCEFNRDTGWAVLGELGFEGVRQVAIDEDWSALRFRRAEYIRTMRRDPSRAMSAQGRRKVDEETGKQ
ncbi:MAG: hypothetical protein BroJett021_27630 [Chloroflexota bacterium]|nr:hypothetical protein [Caldilinea sp.]GIK73775.1 MAG: hypothetical protein BroJett021_27630 [Chloroflexota bacterium]